ncbi:MAG: TolC family protein, partial [Phycisphaerae bacterium]
LADSAEAPAPFESADGLSLLEAEAVALHFNPQLRSTRAASEAPLASAKEAGWWPDPQFEAELLRFVDRGEKTRFKLDGPSFDGINAGGLETTPPGFRRVEDEFIDNPWIVGAGLSITIPISGRLAVDKDLRWSEYSAAWRRILVEEWNLITELRTTWLGWSSSKEKLRMTREYVAKLELIAGITEQLVAAGEMKPTEGRLLQIELSHRRTSLLSLERDEQQARLGLLSLMGIAPSATVTLHPRLSIAPAELPSEIDMAVLMAHHPQIKSVEADYEAAEQRLRLEIRRQYPDLDIGPSYSFEEGFARFGLGVGFPIPLWNRNRQAIAEAFAEREAARVRAEAVVERVLSDLALVELRLKYARRRRQAILETVAPLVEKQVEDSRTLLDLGEVDVLLLRDALTASLETKLDLLDAALAEGRATNELQQMLQPRWFTPSQVNQEETD